MTDSVDEAIFGGETHTGNNQTDWEASFRLIFSKISQILDTCKPGEMVSYYAFFGAIEGVRDHMTRITEEKNRFCETHRRPISECEKNDPSCRVCGCGGLCDSKEYCAMAKQP